MQSLCKVLHSKIHRAKITHADLHYEGSITIPPELMQEAKLYEYEAVHVWNITSGTRFETYTINGLPDSLDICVNGAAARLVSPGDLVIIASFRWLKEDDVKEYHPRVVFVDERNKITSIRAELPGPLSLK